jgi:hypothetical protein
MPRQTAKGKRWGKLPRVVEFGIFEALVREHGGRRCAIEVGCQHQRPRALDRRQSSRRLTSCATRTRRRSRVPCTGNRDPAAAPIAGCGAPRGGFTTESRQTAAGRHLGCAQRTVPNTCSAHWGQKEAGMYSRPSYLGALAHSSWSVKNGNAAVGVVAALRAAGRCLSRLTQIAADRHIDLALVQG